MTEPTLKPCPRCGGEAEILVAPPTSHMSDASFAVECSKCFLIGVYCPNRTMAAAWWNERPGEQRFDSQLDYSIALGRAIEHHCRMVEVPESIAKECPHHAAMLNDHLGRVSRKPEPEPEPTRNAESASLCETCVHDSGTCDGFRIANHCDEWVRRPAQSEPTRNAAEPQHQCPYGGTRASDRLKCGFQGWLCVRCQQDRADARAGVGNRLLAVEEYATAIDAKASSTEVDVQAMSAALTNAQTRLAQVEVRTDDHSRCLTAQVQRIEELESRLPGPQTPTQPERLKPRTLTEDDLDGIVDKVRQAWTPEPAQDDPTQPGWSDRPEQGEPTQHGEARTCGNCGHGCVVGRGLMCRPPLPMWHEDSTGPLVEPDADATHCAAWTAKEAK